MSDPTIKKVLLWIRSPSEKRQADQGRIFTIQEFKETLPIVYFLFIAKLYKIYRSDIKTPICLD